MKDAAAHSAQVEKLVRAALAAVLDAVVPVRVDVVVAAAVLVVVGA